VATFQESLRNAIKSTYCNVLGAGNALWRNAAVVLFGADSIEAREGFRRWAGYQICNKPVPEPAPPFTGGQCPVQYKITITVTYHPIGNPSDIRALGPFDIFAYGKIGAYKVRTGAGVYAEFWECFTTVGSATNPDLKEELVFARIDNTQFEGVTVTQFDVVRVDGQPDVCGDPPPPLDDYDPADYTFDIDVTFSPDFGPDITVPFTFVFGLAYLKADLNLHVPVTINVKPNFNFNPSFNFNVGAAINLNDGDINIGPPTGNDRDAPYPKPPSDFDIDINLPDGPIAPNPPTVPDPPPDVERERGKRVIRGALVTVTSLPGSATPTVLGQDDNPDCYIPDLGLINFQTQLSNGVKGWGPDHRVKNQRCLITCEWPGGATAIRGTPRSTVEFEITPIYGYPEPEVI